MFLFSLKNLSYGNFSTGIIFTKLSLKLISSNMGKNDIDNPEMSEIWLSVMYIDFTLYSDTAGNAQFCNSQWDSRNSYSKGKMQNFSCEMSVKGLALICNFFKFFAFIIGNFYILFDDKSKSVSSFIYWLCENSVRLLLATSSTFIWGRFKCIFAIIFPLK